MDVLAFDAKKVDRAVLLTIAAYLLVIAISLMTMVKPAHADGQVNPINVYTINSGGYTNGCIGKASAAEAMQCDVDFTNSYLDGAYAQISSWGGYDIAICPRAAAHDLNTSNPSLYVFKESPIYGLFAYLPPNPKIAVCTGGGEATVFINVIPSSCPSYTNAGFPCTCRTGYQPDAAQTSCVPEDTCKVKPLPPLPTDDACAQSLDAGLGKDLNGKCPPLDDRLNGTYGQLQCFADKMAALNVTANPTIPYSGPTATIRDAAYQSHLQNVWDKMIELNSLSDPAQISACQSLREKVIAEKGCDSSGSCGDVCTPGSHCLDYRPPDSTNHSAGTAFDVSRSTINGLLGELTPLPPAPMTALQKLQAQRIWIADWLASPTACNLFWGGNWQNPDYIHFQLP